MRSIVALAFGFVLATGVAQAAVTGFVGNVGGNAADWGNYVAGTGQPVNTGIDFESHPIGTLDGSWYQGSHGVTMNIVAPIDSGVADYTSVPTGSTNCPCSSGEGQMPFSRILFYRDQATLTVSFAMPVSGFGLYVGDHYDPFGTDAVVLEAFSGANGTGASLGTFTLPSYNFQLGNQVFMGLASATREIGSVVLTDGFAASGDGVYLDNFQIAGLEIPEPTGIGAVLLGLAVPWLRGRRRRRG